MHNLFLQTRTESKSVIKSVKTAVRNITFLKYGEILKDTKEFNHDYPVDTERKLNVHTTFRRSPGRLNVLSTFSLRPVSTGYWI